MTKLPLFVFGTLCHAPLRDLVVGERTAVRPAFLPDYASHWVDGADHPMLVATHGAAADGVLVDNLTATQLERLNFFEAGFAYDLIPTTVICDGEEVPALRYAEGAGMRPSAVWRLSDWVATYGPLWVATAEETMSYFGRITPEALAARMPMIRLRASTRLRASDTAPTTLRSDMSTKGDVSVIRHDRPYANYFVIEELELQFRRFDGGMSETVTRAGFVGGDAVTVLPYDGIRDEVLLIEQFRMGPFLRGDPKPWLLEPIAGRVDPGEATETTARREALEEARLSLGKLHLVAPHYPSPGAVTEFVYPYVAEADLAGRGGEVAGLSSEAENIRSHVISFDRLMDLVQSGEACAGPLIISAYWLAMNRAWLRASG